jgi:hypothetical protein
LCSVCHRLIQNKEAQYADLFMMLIGDTALIVKRMLREKK